MPLKKPFRNMQTASNTTNRTNRKTNTKRKIKGTNNMLLNPRDEYFKNKGIEQGIEQGKLEIATKLLKKGNSIEEITQLTGLTEKQILNATTE